MHFGCKKNKIAKTSPLYRGEVFYYKKFRRRTSNYNLDKYMYL